MALAAELKNQARQALDLAQTRYDLGLSSIVELSQAQLSLTSAEITNTSARYDYQLQRAVLAYQAGDCGSVAQCNANIPRPPAPVPSPAL
jgi:outer membrane protein